MSLNHHLPTRECASVAALLPLAGRDLLSEQEAARLQTHLASCAHCRAELALDAQIEAALRRSYAPPEDSSPLLSREEIAALLSVPAAQAAPKASASARQMQTPPPVIPAPAERSARSGLGGLPALAATLVIILLTVAIFGIPGLFPGLRRSAAQPPNLAGITLTSISMVSASEGWAVGAPTRSLQNIPPLGGPDYGPVLLHYHNGQWTKQLAPPLVNDALSNYVLRSVSMVSASEGWAVGATIPLQGVIDAGTSGVVLHYTGGHWLLAPIGKNDLGAQLRRVVMRSATDGWIVGWNQANDPSGYALVLHYDGHAWQQVEAPVFSKAYSTLGLLSVAEAPDGEVWMAGTRPQGSCIQEGADAIMFRYNGHAWSSEPVTPSSASIFNIAMLSASDGWAVGFQPGGVLADSNCQIDQSKPGQGIILHYQHGQWQEAALIPGDGQVWYFQLVALAMVSPDEGWAVGAEGTIVHYHNGVWARVPSPIAQEGGALYSVAMVSATEGWAVGDYGTILHYHNGAWSVMANTPPQPAPTATPQLDLSQYSLHGISMVSPTEGWAVGNTWTMVNTGSSSVRMDGGDPVILHYQSGRWTPQPLPDYKQRLKCGANTIVCPAFALRSIYMVSATEGWAAGSSVLPPNADGITFALLLHYSSGRWELVDTEVGSLNTIVMRSANDGWMLGSLGMHAQSGLLHYDGHSWTPVSDPVFVNIARLTMTETPNGEVWISGVDYSAPVGNGEDGNEPAVLLHYDGQRWSKIDPHLANARLSGLFFGSPDEGWAVGTLPNTDQHGPAEEDGVILHYSNGVWQQQKLFKDPLGQSSFSFSSVAMVSPDEGWAVGDEGVILHYHNGAWGEFQNPTGQALYSVVMVSPGEGWAVGDGVIVHYQAGSWRVYNG